MNLFKLSWKNLWAKPLSSLLSLLLFTLGVSIISLILLLNKQMNEAFLRNLEGIDMVVGAKGSPLQLILASVYHIDDPTGNIAMQEAMALTRNPVIEKAIPLAYGDSYRSYRIVGTDTSYISHYGASLAQGRLWEGSLEVVVGSKVANALGLAVGDEFYGSHGLVDDANVHDAHPYEVVGVLAPSGTVLDQLLLTDLSSVWAVHEEHAPAEESGSEAETAHAHEEGEEHDHEEHDHEEHDHEEHAGEAAQEADRQITSLLVKFRNKGMGLFLPRMINENTNMQAALPAIQVNRLRENLGIGVVVLQGVALAIVIISGLSVFISLYNALKARTYEMALMRSMGASRQQLLLMILLEGVMLSILGLLLGLITSRVGMWLLSRYADEAYHYTFSPFTFLPEEGILLGLGLGVGLLAATIPALQAFNLKISQTLAHA